MNDDTIAPKSECLCTDRFVHSSCLRKYIEETGNATCPVCLMPYANIIIKKTRQSKLNSIGMASFLLFIANITIYSGIGVLVHDNHIQNTKLVEFRIERAVIILMWAFITVVTILWTSHCCYYKVEHISYTERTTVVSMPARRSF